MTPSEYRNKPDGARYVGRAAATQPVSRRKRPVADAVRMRTDTKVGKQKRTEPTRDHAHTGQEVHGPKPVSVISRR